MDAVSSRGMADDERDWRFDPEDVSDDGIDTKDEIEQLRSMDPEPGSPSIENSAFVVLGAAVTIALLLLIAGFI
jgi:hypothetical protein